MNNNLRNQLWALSQAERAQALLAAFQPKRTAHVTDYGRAVDRLTDASVRPHA